MGNIKNNIKQFVLNYKITLSIIVFLFLSFGIYLFVSAEENIFDDQIEIKSAKVTVKDGVGTFDADNSAGNDSADNNKIVRNFDTIQYNVTYELKMKDDSEVEGDSTPTRTVIADVLLRADINAKVTLGDLGGQDEINSSKVTINGVEYNYFKFEVPGANLVDESNLTINITDINMRNGDKILPKIRIREKTDKSKEDYKDSEVEVSDTLNLGESITVSAKEVYGVKLYSRNSTNKEGIDKANIPTGIAIYLPSDDKKGIKGIQVPSEVTFNLGITSSSTNSTIDDVTIESYKDEPYIPEPLDNDSSIASINKNEGIYSVNITGISYKGKSVNIGDEENVQNVPCVTIKKALIKTSRNSAKENITYTITAKDTSVEVIDSYEKFVGDYLSKVDFITSGNIESSTDSTEPVTTEPNEAFFNYNEEFYIQNKMMYGLQSGDTLPNGFVNYLKIDNDAIKIINIGNSSDQTKDYYLGFGNDKYDYTLKYGIGEWKAEYFSIKEGAPSYCPKDLSKLGKEQLMNYYGGPCIQENDKVKWFDSIEEAAGANEANRDKIIAVKVSINGEYKNGTITTLRLKAKIANNTALVGNTYQVVARGTTTWNNEEFYMYQPEKSTDIPVSVSKQKSDITYKKVVYDNVNYAVSADGKENPSGKYGNSVIVTGIKASINDIKVYDSYSAEKNVIYSGLTDPMEIQIRPIIYKSDNGAALTSASIEVSLPDVINVYIQKGDKTYSSVRKEAMGATTPTNPGEIITRNVYTYTYSEEEIKANQGILPILKLHAYISIDVKDETPAIIYAKVSGIAKTEAGASIVTNTPSILRTKSKDITLRNIQKISTLGKVDPIYIDQNGNYKYNMSAVNLSGESSKLELLHILPYIGDGGSKFNGNFSFTINGVPDGYEAYYTTDESKTILSKEKSDNSDVKWVKITDYNAVLTATAIKIVPVNAIENYKYFASEQGITLNITTKGNKESDIYYHNFYILDRNATICVDETEEDDICKTTEKGIFITSSNVSNASVYNRSISGYAFEDNDYNGLYTDRDNRIGNIPVDLVKIKNPNYKVEQSKNPIEVINDKDTTSEEVKVNGEKTINDNGYYKFSGLQSGNYYVRYQIDCEKYTTTEKNKQDMNLGDTSLIDSDAAMIQNGDVCYAVSNIITLDNNNVNADHIDLGLRIRQNFDVKLSKYITNIKVTSNRGTDSYDYNRESKVKIDVKNLKNTSFRVSYLIEIENSKYFPGTIGSIIETIPDGMTFDPNIPENSGWYESDGNIYNLEFSKTLVMPGEKYYIPIVLDLKTDTGGNYINFVTASNLKVMPTTTNFLEEIELNEEETGKTEQDKQEGDVNNE